MPRVNPDVNKHWMCDEGRFTYKRVARPSAWPRRCRAARRSSGTARSTTPARALRAVLDAAPGQVGVVFNAQSTNEDLYALARLAFDHLHVGKAYLAGLRPGLERRHPASRRQEPEHRGRDARSARAGCAACSTSPTT